MTSAEQLARPAGSATPSGRRVPEQSGVPRLEQDPQPPPTAHRGDIQGLRALAVGTVVLSHAGVAGMAGGYVGVDVFFVISGFLITGILAREVRRTGRVSILDFYARRARRILPAASVTLVGITVASWLIFGYTRLSQILDDVVWAGLFGANIDFARADTDYFAQDTFVSPVQHFWSLAVEEQFYLLWPALIALVALITRRRAVRTVAVTLLVLSAVSFAWSMHRTGAAPTSAYFSTFTRGWELGAGALLALGARFVQQFTRGFLSLLSWAGLAMILWSCVTYTDATPFPGSAAAVPVVGCFLVIAGGMRPTTYGAGWLLDRAPLRWLGDISYSLYLVHWPILIIPAAVSDTDLTGEHRAWLVVAAVAVAWASHRFVETPFRTAHFWRRRRVTALALWPAAITLVLVPVLAVGSTIQNATAARARIDPTQTSAAGQVVDVQRAVQNSVARARAGDPIPAALRPNPLNLKADNWTLPSDCFADTADRQHRICTFGDTGADRTLVLYGDSHMGMWTEPIFDLAEAAGWKVIPFIKTGCPPIDTTMWRPERSDRFRECDQYRAWANRQIEKIAPERIVVAGYLQSEVADPRGKRAVPSNDPALATRLLAQGMAPALQQLREVADDVTVLSDTFMSAISPQSCLGVRHATLATCMWPVDAVTAARNDEWKAAAARSNARWVDVHPWLCAEGRCPLVVGNVVVYTDRHHLTRTFARFLEPMLGRALRLEPARK